MAVLGNNADALYQGLSDFWLKLFADTADLRAMYQGTSVVIGQAYLDLLNTVLGSSVLDTPLFRKQLFRQVSIRADQLVYVDTGVYGQARYKLATDDYVASMPSVQNKVYGASAVLEQGIDYDVTSGSLRFVADPTNPVTQGFAWRNVDVAVGGTFSATGEDWVVDSVQQGDSLIVHHGEATATLTIVQVTSSTLVISAATPIPGILAASYSWSITRTQTDGNTLLLASDAAESGTLTATKTWTVREISGWAVDAQIDEQILYKNFGYLIYPSRKSASSEVYRQFLLGIMQLYLFGPAMGRVESALNLIADLPLISNDGEVLSLYDSGVNFNGNDGSFTGNNFSSAANVWSPADVGGYLEIDTAVNASNVGTFRISAWVSAHTVTLLPNPVAGFVNESGINYTYSYTHTQTVTTDRNTYLYPLNIPIRSDVKDPANYGVLTFKSFETLTTAVRVTDYLEDPEWWHHITIPQQMLPDMTQAQRAVSIDLYANVLGAQNGGLRIGDPGFFIGRDSAGNAVSPAWHHNAAFILMDQFLKFHMFLVDLDKNIDLSGTLIAEMQGLLREVKPAYTFVYFEPTTVFMDTLTITDTLIPTVVYRFYDTLIPFDNQLTIGSTWHIGDRWHYTSSNGSGVATGTGSGDMALAIGGTNPFITPTSGTTNLFDQALHVTAS